MFRVKENETIWWWLGFESVWSPLCSMCRPLCSCLLFRGDFGPKAPFPTGSYSFSIPESGQEMAAPWSIKLEGGGSRLGPLLGGIETVELVFPQIRSGRGGELGYVGPINGLEGITTPHGWWWGHILVLPWGRVYPASNGHLPLSPGYGSCFAAHWKTQFMTQVLPNPVSA